MRTRLTTVLSVLFFVTLSVLIANVDSYRPQSLYTRDPDDAELYDRDTYWDGISARDLDDSMLFARHGELSDSGFYGDDINARELYEGLLYRRDAEPYAQLTKRVNKLQKIISSFSSPKSSPKKKSKPVAHSAKYEISCLEETLLKCYSEGRCLQSGVYTLVSQSLKPNNCPCKCMRREQSPSYPTYSGEHSKEHSQESLRGDSFRGDMTRDTKD